MTKNELIEAIISDTNMTKKDAETVLKNLTTAIRTTLKGGNDFTIAGIGKLKPDARAARTARNPSTGATIDVPAKTVVKFKVAKELADAVA